MRSMKKRLRLNALTFIILIGMSVSLVLIRFHREIERREYERGVEQLMDYAQQNAFVIERILQGYLNTLSGIASFLSEGDLKTEKNMNYLREVENAQNFSRLGVIGMEGILWTTDGAEVDLSDRQYLKDVFEKKNWVITGIEDSRVTGNKISVLVVPVLDGTGEVKGAVHGVIRQNEFHPYGDFEARSANRYIQVIDRKGNYIMGKELPLRADKDANLFKDLEMSESDITTAEVIELIQKGESFLCERVYGGKDYLLYFQAIQLSDWYIITVMEKQIVSAQSKSILNKIVYPFMLQIIGYICLLSLIIIYCLGKVANLKQKQESALREQLLSDADGFLVINLYEDKILKATEELIACCGKECTYSQWLTCWQKERVLDEYREYVMEKMSRQTMLESFKKGRQYETIEYPVKREAEIAVWKECSIRVEEENEKLVAYLVCRDVSNKKQKELMLQEHAEKDYLTGLYNRRGFLKLMKQYFKAADKGDMHIFILLDLDNFKMVNDVLGHQMGDKALQDVAKILRQHFREYDIIGRLGGDEFVVLVKNIPRNIITKNVEALLEKLLLTYTKNNVSVSMSASIGISVVPVYGMTFEKLYEKADQALYHVKENGKGSFCFLNEAVE